MLILYIFYFLILFYLLYLSIKDNDSYKRFIIKIISCSLFIVIFIIHYFQNKIPNMIFIPMLVAFILSFFGDIGLGYAHINTSKINRACGFIGFSLAQVIFIYTFINNFGFNLYLLIIPILGVLLGLYFVYRLKINSKGIYLLSFIYMSLVTMMFSSTLSAFINLNNSFSLFLLIGGISFAISDYTLLFKYYDKKHKTIFTCISVLTYGIAQFLLATSILFY